MTVSVQTLEKLYEQGEISCREQKLNKVKFYAVTIKLNKMKFHA